MSRTLHRFFLALSGVAAVLAGAMASHSNGHEQKTALTDIFFNQRSGNLEIAHRIRVHDAEHALRKATDSEADLALSEKAQAAFAKYVAERFELSFKDQSKLKLTLVGQEIERGYLWVYQETKIADLAADSFFIKNTILQDAVKGQINTVNVRSGSEVATFGFDAETRRQFYPGSAKAEADESADDVALPKGKNRSE